MTTLDEEIPETVFADPPSGHRVPDRVAAILAALPERYRRILELRFLDACSVREAAAELGISVTNAKVLQYRALRLAAQVEQGVDGVNGRASRRFVEDLLHGRRPHRFPAEEADVAELRTAIGLRAARPGSGAPREEFVTDLHRRLTAELADTDPEDGPARVVGCTRRRFVQGAAVAAAAAAVGVVVDRTVISRGRDEVPGDDAGRAGGGNVDPDRSVTGARSRPAKSCPTVRSGRST